MKKKILKTIIYILILILLIIVGVNIYRLSFIKRIEKRANESLKDNYKIVQKTFYDNKLNNETTTYKLNANAKEIISRKSSNINDSVIYYDLNEKNRYYIYENEIGLKKVVVLNFKNFTMPIFENINSITNFDMSYLKGTDISSKIQMLMGYLFCIRSIKTENVNGIECYAIKYILNETVYVNKDTGYLVRKSWNDGKDYIDYEISSGIVKEDDVALPDFSDYYVSIEQ